MHVPPPTAVYKVDAKQEIEDLQRDKKVKITLTVKLEWIRQRARELRHIDVVERCKIKHPSYVGNEEAKLEMFTLMRTTLEEKYGIR